MALEAPVARALALERRLHAHLQRSFERRYGIATAEHVDLGELGVAGEDRISYYATPAVALRAALQRLRPGPGDVVLDLGSGKGQAVITAATFPVSRVIGVELSAELTELARRNVQAAREKLRCPEIELLTADALTWPIPEDASIIYLYCPFIGDLFRSVLTRVFASFDARPRPLVIVYGYPWEHNWLVRTGRVQTVDVSFARWPARPGWWDSDHVFVTYLVTAPDGSAPERPLAGRGLVPGRRRALAYWSRPNGTRFVLYPPGGGQPLRSS